MAEWKKVVVSGSNISQLNNDANYLASGDTTTLSGSFSGSFFGDGSGLSGVAASFPTTYVAPADAVKIFVNDGASKFTSASAFANYTFGKISGDATVAAGGALTIANSAVEGTMLNSNVADGTTITLSSNTLSTLKVPNALTAGSGLTSAGTFDGAAARTFTVNSGSMLQFYSSSIQTGVFAKVSGDATINSSGVISVTSATSASYIQGANVDGTVSNATTAATASSVAVNSVALGTDTTGDYVASLGSGTGVTIGSNSGEGSNPTIAVDYGSTSNTAVQGNTTITLTQTAGEIDITGTAAQALGGGPSYTIGLADTISGNRTFSGATITINNDLVVQGTASFQNTTNLEVADQFILLNSGSTTDNSPGGIVVQQDTQDEGVLFGYDAAAGANAGRWGVTSSFDASSTTFTADAYVSYVLDIDAGQSDIALYQKNGNIKVDSGDIFIYA